MQPLVSITIVTFNSSKFIRTCLETVFAQTHPNIEVVIVDNASADGTAALLERYWSRARIFLNPANAGFAAGQNQAIDASTGEWVLALNPDVRLAPDFIERLLSAGRRDPKIGAVCGKLLRATPGLDVPREPRVDSAGIVFTSTFRHFDRGWNQPDNGHFSRAEYVFGASAAAALYRREMIADVALDDGFFDPDFFSYREDADLAWRAQLMGWRCYYEPSASAYHVRRVTPGSRRATPPALRMHSVKNRFLMRLKNATGDLYRRNWLPVTLRDVVVLGGCLLSEPRSMPAFWHVGRHLRRTIAKRRWIMDRRRVSDRYLAGWFGAGAHSSGEHVDNAADFVRADVEVGRRANPPLAGSRDDPVIP